MTSKCGENKMWHTRRSRVCHWWPAEGSYHIREVTNILKILSNFDYQRSERILLNILRERWRHIITCIINNGNRNWVESDSVKSHTRGKNLLNFGNSLDFFLRQVVVAMVIVINTMIGGFGWENRQLLVNMMCLKFALLEIVLILLMLYSK